MTPWVNHVLVEVVMGATICLCEASVAEADTTRGKAKRGGDAL